jgi:hypothetical protein
VWLAPGCPSAHGVTRRLMVGPVAGQHTLPQVVSLLGHVARVCACVWSQPLACGGGGVSSARLSPTGQYWCRFRARCVSGSLPSSAPSEECPQPHGPPAMPRGRLCPGQVAGGGHTVGAGLGGQEEEGIGNKRREYGLHRGKPAPTSPGQTTLERWKEMKKCEQAGDQFLSRGPEVGLQPLPRLSNQSPNGSEGGEGSRRLSRGWGPLTDDSPITRKRRPLALSHHREVAIHRQIMQPLSWRGGSQNVSPPAAFRGSLREGGQLSGSRP